MSTKKKNTALSLLRTLLTVAGTYLATTGKISAGDATAIVGALTAFLSAFWDAKDEHDAENSKPITPTTDPLDHP
jgi:hypothetical protein